MLQTEKDSKCLTQPWPLNATGAISQAKICLLAKSSNDYGILNWFIIGFETSHTRVFHKRYFNPGEKPVLIKAKGPK